MSANELAKRYGQALWTLATERAVQRQVTDELDALAGLIGRDQLLHACLADPTVPLGAKQSILGEMMIPEFNQLTRRFIGLLVEKRRVSLLTAIVRFLAANLDKQDGRYKVSVASALPLADAERLDLLRRLTQWLNKKVEMEITVVPELIAGITIRIGDCLIDGSCRGHLARMRQVLMA